MNWLAKTKLNLLLACIVLLLAVPSIQLKRIFRKGARQHYIKNGNGLGEPWLQEDASFIETNNKQFRARISTVSLEDAQRTTVGIYFRAVSSLWPFDKELS